MNDFETPTGIILTKQLKQLLDHVQLVAALREREACAALCNDISTKSPDLSVKFAAHAIRARSNG